MMKVGKMDTAMIALLPTTSDWCSIDLPHLTLVFSGKIEDHPTTDFNKMAKDAASIALVANPITLDVRSVEPLGPPEDLVSALMFRPKPELMAMRNFVKQWDRSEYSEFRPHATIGPYPSPLEFPPRRVSFDRLLVAWGDDQITFWLRRC